jgi:hypothetical protein
MARNHNAKTGAFLRGLHPDADGAGRGTAQQ